MEVVLGTKIKGLNMLNQLGWLIWSYKSYMFVCFIHMNVRTKEKLIKVIVKYLKCCLNLRVMVQSHLVEASHS